MKNEYDYLTKNSANTLAISGFSEENRKLFGELLFQYIHLHRHISAREFHPENPAIFSHLEKRIVETGERTGAKIKKVDYGKDLAQKKDNHTDEQVIAAGIYTSLITQRLSAIVTCDGDLEKLLTASVLYFMRNKGYANPCVGGNLRRFPVALYRVSRYESKLINVTNTAALVDWVEN